MKCWSLRCLWTSWRLCLYVHKQLEKDSRKHSQPDEKVVRGVVRWVPEGAEHRRQDGEAREELGECAVLGPAEGRPPALMSRSGTLQGGADDRTRSGSWCLTAGTWRAEIGRAVRKLVFQASHSCLPSRNECQFSEGSVPGAVEMNRGAQPGGETREWDG